jgi:hypothetical protein
MKIKYNPVHFRYEDAGKLHIEIKHVNTNKLEVRKINDSTLFHWYGIHPAYTIVLYLHG